MKTKTQGYSIEQLYRRIQFIDLDPEFQRGKVWTVSRQQALIDSILRGWGIPKVFLASKANEETYICIDGKQRLSAIFSFMSNGFFLNEKFTKKVFNSDDFSQFKGKKYSELPPKIQDKINKYKITVEVVTKTNEAELGELFRRLQQGLVLSSAEKLKANNSNIGKFILSLNKHRFFKKIISVSNSRNAHFAVASQLSLMEVSGRVTNAKYANLEKFFQDYSSFNPKGFEARRIKEILNYLSRIFEKKSPELANRANIVSFFLLISEIMKRGDIKGKEKLLYRFFKKFVADLKKEKNKDFLKYQNATIQAADSAPSIRIRHEILQRKLVNFSPFFRKLLNISVDEEKFKNLYNKLEKKHGGNPKDFNSFLKEKYPKGVFQCGKYEESIPIHIRHRIHHSEHPSFTKKQLSQAIKMLEKLR